MKISRIESSEDYQLALREIEKLMDATEGSPEGIRLQELASMVIAWEEKHYRMDK